MGRTDIASWWIHNHRLSPRTALSCLLPVLESHTPSPATLVKFNGLGGDQVSRTADTETGAHTPWHGAGQGGGQCYTYCRSQATQRETQPDGPSAETGWECGAQGWGALRGTGRSRAWGAQRYGALRGAGSSETWGAQGRRELREVGRSGAQGAQVHEASSALGTARLDSVAEQSQAVCLLL